MSKIVESTFVVEVQVTIRHPVQHTRTQRDAEIVVQDRLTEGKLAIDGEVAFYENVMAEDNLGRVTTCHVVPAR